MIILSVKFKSNKSFEEVQQLAEERAPLFRALEGLIQKYYCQDKQTGDICGIYLWENEETLNAYRNGELVKTIAVAYDVVGTPRVEIMDMFFPLRT